MANPGGFAVEFPQPGVLTPNTLYPSHSLKDFSFSRYFEYLLQLFGFAAAVVFGVWSIKSFEAASIANRLSTNALDQSVFANKMALYALCLSSGSMTDQDPSLITSRVVLLGQPRSPRILAAIQMEATCASILSAADQDISEIGCKLMGIGCRPSTQPTSSTATPTASTEAPTAPSSATTPRASGTYLPPPPPPPPPPTSTVASPFPTTSTPTETSGIKSPAPTSSNPHLSYGVIVGIVVGGIFVIGNIIFFLFCVRRSLGRGHRVLCWRV